ncbi:MAG TPA: hypothetical protein VGA73_16355, partial [Candidatus Binatia bacterium]
MVSDEAAAPSTPGESSPFAAAYRVFGRFGLFSIFGALLYGFQYEDGAPAVNFAYNLLLYAIFVTPHLLMTRSWF